MEYNLDKLGVVLGVCNDINKKMLELNTKAINMLEEQQKRQTQIIYFSIAVIFMAFLVTCYSTYTLSQQVQLNTEFKYVYESEKDKEVPRGSR